MMLLQYLDGLPPGVWILDDDDDDDDDDMGNPKYEPSLKEADVNDGVLLSVDLENVDVPLTPALSCK